ncbi:hypothetical protein METBIDRAFT_30114 [Metschnikowia bicuspidata var. bicuspidata NRRL YB-4993]|uniref:Autophagy-related protein 27 n=1 Tax=Metschnikowia bicuspidata var. bicuspidata NRRL YB-4993 TaxID=869754 RepID=A0A1A0HIH9_9ASCO|nr:hypothetical protein METBIDRAFT_30114 [Metschnikowia bicuspidata var. bicuspidata NRRL YB-4993]OBA23687.1 hypothetical protein METBIDRAFT_30114 [Metschnikowia bicuspidata var. bicuspidata NRRL YB-4993]
MAIMKFIYAAVLAASVASAFDCSVKELSQYNFQSIRGEYSDTITKSTPPSKSVFTWSIGVCQNIEKHADCPKNSDVCGTTRIQVEDKDVLSEVIGFNSNLQKEYIPFGSDSNDQESGVNITYRGVNWGDLLVDGTIKFVCTTKGDTDENKLKLIGWNGALFEGEFRSPAACINSNKGNKLPPKENKGNDNGESWGWFTWLFIFMVLFLSIYIIGGAWFQYNKGNSIDFQSALKEVLENFVDLLRGLPAFVKEVVEKVTGNSNRGEYSAV